MTSSLPPELTDVIISHLDDDLRSLRASGLVCRTWLPASRSPLYRYLKIKDADVDRFLSLLSSPHNTFFSTVWALELVLLSSESKTTQLITHLSQFSRLEGLAIVMREVPYDLVPTLPSVTALKLRIAHAPPIPQLHRFISRLPMLKQFRLGTIRRNERPFFPASPMAISSLVATELEEVAMDGVCFASTVLVDWLISTPRVASRCLSLELSGFHPDLVAEGVSRALKSLGPHIHDLRLSFSDVAIASDLPGKLTEGGGLDFCTALTTVQISGLIRFIPQRQRPGRLWLLDISPSLHVLLRRLQPTGVRVLVLDVDTCCLADAHTPAHMDSVILALVDTISLYEVGSESGLEGLEFHGKWGGARSWFREHLEVAFVALLPPAVRFKVRFVEQV
ncbi:hypothetical protein FB45DRAFT_920903 [Roridomyces roridus]|uniref:F-box domain-containing protein n=1 Tax=Roridomyces roridus TaxID=1738132 RepID=A0AAD7BQ99_9AGAR|nr:hypothetical protein FB45DRAFT_920903 [Roridomyces roridus]